MKTIKRFEHFTLVNPDTAAGAKVKRKPSSNWKRWPKPYRLQSQAAVDKHMAGLPKGAKIIRNRSRCDARADLSGVPWQLFREITVQMPT